MHRIWIMLPAVIAAIAIAGIAHASDADSILGRTPAIEEPAGPVEPFYVYA